MVSSGSDGGSRGRYFAALIVGIGVIGMAIGVLTYAYQLGNISGYQAAEKQGYSQNEAASTNQAIGQCRLKPEPTLEECIAKQIKAGRDDNRSEQDLHAQRQMALWAWYLLMVTLAQIPLSIAGLFALIYTIRQGRDANRIANASALAQNRAWLIVESIDLSSMRYEFSDGKLVVFGEPEFIIKNTGRSAATDIWSRTAVDESNGIWSKIFEAEEFPEPYECVPPDGTIHISTDIYIEIPLKISGNYLAPMKAGISLKYLGGGPDQFITECLWTISSWPDDPKAAFGDTHFMPHFGASMSFDAYPVFSYFRIVT